MLNTEIYLFTTYRIEEHIFIYNNISTQFTYNNITYI